jgi:hypothetical protein
MFIFSTGFRPALGTTELPMQWVAVVKRQEREVDTSPASSAKVKNSGAVPPLPHVFMAGCFSN